MIVFVNYLHSIFFFHKGNNEYQKIERDEKHSSYLTPLNIGFGIGYGFGRIEDVEDAVESLYILKDLNQYGKLKKSLNEDEISLLADRITKLRKVRYFDFRSI